MKIAIPLKNEAQEIFTNAGHTPFFGIFEVKGSGMFKKFDLVEMRENPRVNLEAEMGCSHSHDDSESCEEKEAHKKRTRCACSPHPRLFGASSEACLQKHCLGHARERNRHQKDSRRGHPRLWRSAIRTLENLLL